MRSSPRVVFKSFDFGSNSENFCISQDETKIIDCLNDKIDHLQRKLSNVQNLIVKYEQDKKNKIIN